MEMTVRKEREKGTIREVCGGTKHQHGEIGTLEVRECLLRGRGWGGRQAAEHH